MRRLYSQVDIIEEKTIDFLKEIWGNWLEYSTEG